MFFKERKFKNKIGYREENMLNIVKWSIGKGSEI